MTHPASEVAEIARILRHAEPHDSVQGMVIGTREWNSLLRRKLIKAFYSLPDVTPDQCGERLRFFALLPAAMEYVAKPADRVEIERKPLRLRAHLQKDPPK